MSRQKKKNKSNSKSRQDGSAAGTPAKNPTTTPQDPAGKNPGGTTKSCATESGAGQMVDASSFLSQLPSLSRIMSVVMLIFGIIAVGILFYRVMAVFFVPLFMAAALVVIFRPVNNWLITKLGNRRRTAAVVTTGMVLLVVLLPILLVLSVAATQFTALVGQANFDDLTAAIDRARTQFGMTLPHAEQFRRLDSLADSMDEPREANEVLESISEAKDLVVHLQNEVEGPPQSEPAAEIAQIKLDEFSAAVKAVIDTDAQAGTIKSKVDATDMFHRQSVIASASIRSWMHALLGGSFRSQLRLLANPSDGEFAQLLSKSRETLQPRFVKFTSVTGTILIKTAIGLVILVIAVYFFLIDGSSMMRTLMRLSPLDDNYELQLLSKFDKTSRAVVLATLSSAVIQGLLAALAFWFFGLKSVVLLFLATCLMALIPFLGAASVWVPCALYLGAVEQNWWSALFLGIYGALVVSSIDNVIKAYVLHDHSQLHPLFALLSVLGGVQVFGPIGILVGPMVVVFLQTLLEILNHELTTEETPHELKKNSETISTSSQS